MFMSILLVWKDPNQAQDGFGVKWKWDQHASASHPPNSAYRNDAKPDKFQGPPNPQPEVRHRISHPAVRAFLRRAVGYLCLQGACFQDLGFGFQGLGYVSGLACTQFRILVWVSCFRVLVPRTSVWKSRVHP